MTHLGCIKSPQDDRDWKYEALPLLTSTTISLPKTFDLRPHLTPVRDQGNLGTCAAFSASCIKEYHEKIDNPSHFNGYMSPFSIYCNRVNKPQEGMHLRDVMKILKTQGASREEVFPYGSVEPRTIPTPVIQDALRFKISGYAQISTIDAAKKALMISGPLLVAFPYYENGLPQFWRAKAGIQLSGGHAVTIVGWNENGFIIRNSWGNKWNGDGHVLFEYSEWGCQWEIWSCVDERTIWTSPVPVPRRPIFKRVIQNVRKVVRK